MIWQHDGRRFRSQIVIRSNGRRSTEAFLFETDAEGRWHPFCLPDGTVSDGKTGTYNRCVEHLLGGQETFCTSVFSAQGKRQLSSYQNGEIKTLLADLLGQEECRNQGKKASQVVDLLKAGLVTLRQQQAGLEDAVDRLHVESRQLGDVHARVEVCAGARDAAQSVQHIARARLAEQQTAAAQAGNVEGRRTRLYDDRKELIQAGKRAIESIVSQQQSLRAQLARLDQRVATRRAHQQARLQMVMRERHQCEAVLLREACISRAERRLALAESVVVGRSQLVCHARGQIQELQRCGADVESAKQRLQVIEREAGQAALRADDLARRFGLTVEVPCVGTELQGHCKLLGDAREAHALMPSAQGTIRRLSSEKQAVQQQLRALQTQHGMLAGAAQQLERAERREAASRRRAASYGRLAERRDEAQQAKNRMRDLEPELAGLMADAAQFGDGDTPEEELERSETLEALESLAAQQEQQARHYRQMLDRLDSDLAELPPVWDGRALDAAQQGATAAQKAVAEADHEHIQALRDVELQAALARQIQERSDEHRLLSAHVAKVEAQIGNWGLLVKCLGNDGLIALEIDDAGPTLAGLANDLLLACYGPRFTVSILTQVENRKGEQREGFVIEVHDGETGQSKRVEQMSGGERVWINESLVRAVALYLAHSSERRYESLFSDETDGALDPDRKRMFMAMKREVLRLGGYKREFFVSQTPELTAMADVVIDLDAFQRQDVPMEVEEGNSEPQSLCCAADHAHA